jgi:serine phosphatase RsbU (regulator of sigma subunit)
LAAQPPQGAGGAADGIPYHVRFIRGEIVLMASLVVVVDGQTTTFHLQEGQNTVGRHPDCALTIGQASVSGRHAIIYCENDEFSIEDVGSRNGTYVNQQRVETRVPLKHNDAIQFGDALARFDDPDSSLKATAAPTSSATVPDVQATLALGSAGVSIEEEGDATITGQVATEGRFGVLDVNPEAKLKAVLEITNALAGLVDLSSLLPRILDSLFNIFKFADRGCILLKDEARGEMVPQAMKHRREGDDSSVRLSRTVVEKVLKEKQGVLSADASTDEDLSSAQSIADLNIRSIMCVPLLGLDGEPIGVLSIDSQNPLGQFTQDDLGILMTVAGQAALAYENARLVEAYAAKQKQDGELEIAQTVQRSLLPEDFPQVEGYEFYASYDAAQAVGGDYYDCFELPDGRVCLSFGDVAGKGVPGALIMSRMSSCVQSTIRHVHEVEPAINAINDHMCDSAVEGRFVTYVLCIVDTENHKVTLANAGHMSPIIRRADGTVEQFDEELVGPPIGVVDGYPYDAETRDLHPGDLVLIVTDGVDEAMNPEGELYGGDRVLEFVKNGPAKADELGKALLADVRKHAHGRAQNDDITIMTFGRNPT